MSVDPVQMTEKPDGKNANLWAMALHLSMLLSFSFVGIIAPIVIWQIKKDEMPIIDVHGKNAVNWILSALIYFVICFILLFVVIGAFLMPVLGILSVVFPIIAGIKAHSGEVWKYPLSIQFFK